MIYRDDRLALFIDGANLHSTLQKLGYSIDYERLREEFAGLARLVTINYYTAVKKDSAERDPLRPRIDWMEYNGFNLVTKPAKEFTEPDGTTRTKGNMDIELGLDAFKMAAAGQIDHMVFFTGDGDFVRLFEEVKAFGVRVTVISSRQTKPSMIADELRRAADAFIDLNDPDFRDRIQQRPRSP